MTIIDFNNAKRQDERTSGGISADDIRARLHANPLALVEFLYSGRAIVGKNEARIGNTGGEPGESLSITLSGKDAGLWYDHATGEGGDLIDLYRAYMGYKGKSDFQVSLKEIAREFFGDLVEYERPSWAPSPRDRIEEKKQKLGTKPPAHVLELGPPVESYGYYDRDNRVVCVVRRYEPGGVDENGKPNKSFRNQPAFPTPRLLYRLPQIIPAMNIVFVEGERKADALAALGIDATSAMGGANTKIEMVDWSPLAGKNITIWPDNDKPGAEFAVKVAQALRGLDCRVAIVKIPKDKPPKWDAWDCIKEGGDPHALINSAAEETSTPIPVMSVSDLRNLPANEWVIPNWVPSDSLGFVYGDPGCGKSFLALDWCLHLCYGVQLWCGIPIKRHGPILYILQEGGRGIVDRIDAWKKHHGMLDDPPGFEVITTSLSFLNPNCVDALVATVRARKRDYRLIVVDTVSRVLPGADENLQKEMTLFIAACDRLRTISAACTIGVHHAGKSGDMRGSTVLRGAGDFVFKLEKEKGVRPITITCEKLKDEADGWEKVVTLEIVQLTEDNKHDFNAPKTSLVITGMVAEATDRGWPPRGVCQQILDAIAEAWKLGRPWSPSHVTRNEGRYAAANITKQFKIKLAVAQDMIEEWQRNGIISLELMSSHSKKKGLKVVSDLAEVVRK